MENIKAKVKYDAIKPCPICGAIPFIEKSSMDRGNGHGYPGEYRYHINCKVCDYPKSQCGDTVSNSHEEARAVAIKKWNIEVEKIEVFLKHRYE